jgi:lipid-A-disaccharide synthase
MKYYIIAGEQSGDLHGSNLMKQLLIEDKNAQFRFWGGDHMLEVSTNLVTHVKEMAFMGFWEVIKNIGTINRFFKNCKADIKAYKPDVVVLIDYPGFNLRMAEWAKKEGFKTVFYISPQLWAWKKGRIKKIQAYVDLMIPILPFEVDFYKEYGVEVAYCGHPLLDAIENFVPNKDFIKEFEIQKPLLAILPGSRLQEVEKMLPTMLKAAIQFKDDFDIVIAATNNLDKNIYDNIINNYNVKIAYNQTYSILLNANIALVTSGTATLETALFEVPEVVCYKGSKISYEIGKRLIDLKYISLVNLIMDKKVVTELIQSDFAVANLITEINNLKSNRQQIKSDYKVLKAKLGGSGASSRIAKQIVEFLEK